MSRHQSLWDSLRFRWDILLSRIREEISAPGYIGPIPYLLMLRWIVFGGTVLRFWLHQTEYTGHQWPWIDWNQILLILGVFGTVTLAATLLQRRTTVHPAVERLRKVEGWIVALDVFFISVFYFLTGNTQSDLFLFYYLPVFSATEYLGSKATLVASGSIALTFLAVLALMTFYPGVPPTTSDLLLQVFIPRMFFFASIVTTSSFLLSLEREQRRRATLREKEIQVLLDFRTEVESFFSIEDVLNHTIGEATKTVEASGGHISLVDHKTRQLSVNVYTGHRYLQETHSYPVDDSLATQVVQKKRAINAYGPKSPPHLGTFLNSRIGSMLCVPIIAHNTVLGALSVGRLSTKSFSSENERFLQALVGQVASAIEKARLFTALDEIGRYATSTVDLDRELDDILQLLTDRIGLEFAAISLVDEYRDIIEMVRGVNVPEGWIKRVKHRLDSSDILAYVVHTGGTEVIEGWDERFDKKIYDRFEHMNLARVFSPIVANDRIVGVIEAGCRRERCAELLSSGTINTIRRVGRERGTRIARARPYRLLQLVASYAMDIIGADSASVHVYRSGQTLLEAGAGRATKEFLRKHPPRKGGIGKQAMQTDGVVKIDDPGILANTHIKLYGEGVRAMAAFPLSVGENVQGVLYVHFWSEHQFSQAELELEKVFARQIELAIQNNLLFKSISAAAQRAWALPHFQNLIQSLTSSRNVTQILEDVAQNVLLIMDADIVTLYVYYPDTHQFDYPPVMRGDFRDEAAMLKHIGPDTLLSRIIQGGGTRFLDDASQYKVLYETSSDDGSMFGFVEREGVRSSAAIILKGGEPEQVVGLLFVNYRRSYHFTAEDRKTANALASSAAIAITTARLYGQVHRDLKQRDKELDALRAVDQAIVSSVHDPDFQPILDLILEKGMEIVGAPAGDIMWFDPLDGILKLRCQRGFPKGKRAIEQNVGDGIVGMAAERRKSILVPDVRSDEWAQMYVPVIPDTRSELAVPLMDESGLLGVLNVEHPEVGAFNEDNRILLETLSVQAIIAIHSVELYQKLERRVESLRALSKIATRIQGARYSLDTVLRLLLTGVTAGEGLRYSRAMLFLTDDEGTKLQGRVAVGAQTQEEAEATWERLGKKVSEVRARGEDVLKWLLDQAEEFSAAVAEEREHDYPLSIAVQGVCIPIERGAGALSTCVLEGTSVIVRDSQSDPFRRIMRRVSQSGDRGRAFACIPLVGKGHTIGTLVTDNRFLISEREIDEDTIDCLEAFGGVIAMSIENTRLQASLAEEQRLAAWKKFTGRIAHVIGTRIGAIKGTATQIRFCLDKASTRYEGSEQIRLFVRELSDGIYKAETVLRDFRQFAKPLELQLQKLDVIQVIETVLQDMRHSIIDIHIDRVFPDQPIYIQGDGDELFHAFAELIKNAKEAMEEQDSDRESKITITIDEEASSTTLRAAVRIEFADTGPGILEENKQQVFEPIFSTKGRGSGLGLAIVKNVVEEHGGTVQEIGIPDVGARFVLYLPLAKHDETMPATEEGGK